MSEKKSVNSFYNQEAEYYKNMYQSDYVKNVNEPYPANFIRLKLIIKRLKVNKAKSVLDIGCGSCTPMIKLLKLGFKVQGVDFSKNMLRFGKIELQKAGFNPNLIYHANIEKNSSMKNGKFDTILALGVFPHLKKEKVALKNMKQRLTKNGKLFMEFRNDIFSTFSLNKFSLDFFINRLMCFETFPTKIKKELIKYYSERLSIKDKIKVETVVDGKISYEEILAKFHNPLTIEEELFMPNHMKVDKIHYYHYHSMPPVFEKKYPDVFRQTSLKREKSDDWKGLFLCSAFVVEASKQ